MKTDTSDERLMRLVAQGDMDAFAQLVLRHQQTAWSAAYRLVADYQTAEDLAQEAFLRILKAAKRYRTDASFRTYLYRIVVRLCLDYHRKGRPLPTSNVDYYVDESSSPEQQAAQKERAQAVQEGLARLPAKQRTVIILRYFEGLSGREIAAAMETTVKAVERLLARGRASLQRLLSGFLEE